jgi:UDP-glucose 4-epimerase
MTALVIGGTGIIGRSLCRALVRNSVKVIATSKSLASVPDIAGVVWRRLDFSCESIAPELLQGIDTVYHLGWSTVPASAFRDPALDVTVNVVGSLRLLQAVRDYSDIRVVFASSGGTIYGTSQCGCSREADPVKPLSAHGISKLTVELYLESFWTLYGVNSISLRIGNCYGAMHQLKSGFGAMATFARNALSGEPIIIYGDGGIIRDYIHADDVAEAAISAAQHRDVHGAVNVGTGVGHSLNDIISEIENILRRPVRVSHLEERPFDIPVSILDCSMALRVLGWSPSITFSEGVRRIIEDTNLVMNQQETQDGVPHDASTVRGSSSQSISRYVSR